VLTTFALNAAELNTSVCTELAAPKAKLLIDTPVKTIKARGGRRTVQILLSTHSLLTTISEEKPKRMLAIKSKPFVKSNETCKSPLNASQRKRRRKGR
jgi:hypothetical protein